MPVIAASSPGDCFYAAIEAVRVALTYRTPVYLLSRRVSRERRRAVARARHRVARADRGRVRAARTARTFLPYKRDPETLARPWAIPGTPGLEHRIGGLEKANITGAISYDPDNHDLMTQLRAQKVAGVKVPDLEVDHQEGADVLVLSWGGTYGPVHAGVRRVRARAARRRTRTCAG